MFPVERGEKEKKSCKTRKERGGQNKKKVCNLGRAKEKVKEEERGSWGLRLFTFSRSRS